MPSRSDKSAPRAIKGIKIKQRTQKKPADKKRAAGGSFVGNFFFMLILFLIASVIYLEVFGVPSFLRGVIPQEIVNILGLNEETAAAQVMREAGVPKLTAYGTRADDPTIPVNGTVEEVVKTMRPDIFFYKKDTLTYVEQALINRIPYQKQAFHIMLSTFYKATPDGVGYLDLAYQAPNFYFVRVVAMDARTRNSYMDRLRTKVVNFVLTDSATANDGTVEFSLHGGFQQPKREDLKNMQLMQRAKMLSEVSALHNLAVANQVSLKGLDKPFEDEFGTHRRVVFRTTTEADYPSLLNFANALQKSDIALGVQKFVSAPAGPEKMQSAIEFVMYTMM
jgi:hypothetical protein